MTDTKSGLNPTPLAQIPIQAEVLCSQRGNSSSNKSSCGISIRQLALLKPLIRSEPGAPILPSQTAELFFEAVVTFNHYPWPEWNSIADASQDVMVSNGDIPPMFGCRWRVAAHHMNHYSCICAALQFFSNSRQCSSNCKYSASIYHATAEVAI